MAVRKSAPSVAAFSMQTDSSIIQVIPLCDVRTAGRACRPIARRNSDGSTLLTQDSLKIVHFPHPALRWESKPLRRVDSELRAMVRQMFELMYEARGIGLAANQVALPYQLFVLNLTGDPEQEDQERVLVNPVIVKRKGTQEEEEGCLSLPEVFATVRRSKSVQVTAYDLEGNEQTLSADGLEARALQHEIDHLQGILFIDKLAEAARLSVSEELLRFEQRYRHGVDRGEIEPEAETHQRLRELEGRRT
jgi:peptide deformylase